MDGHLGAVLGSTHGPPPSILSLPPGFALLSLWVVSTQGSCWPYSKATWVAHCCITLGSTVPWDSHTQVCFTLGSAQILPCSALPFNPHCFIPSFLEPIFSEARDDIPDLN